MIDVISVYQDVARDNANQDENGYLSYEMFNRISRRAELRLLDFLSGDVENQRPPFLDMSQKSRDWLAPLITSKPNQVKDGKVNRPDDYYGWDNAYLLGTYDDKPECEEEEVTEVRGSNTVIELLSRQAFYNRCNTYIEDLKPSFVKPIAKQVGKTFEFMPRDLGSIVLEYIRVPKFGQIKVKKDTVYNDEVADESNSVPYEWDEFARELLIWFITDTFATHTREQALKQQNSLSGKLTRDSKQ